MSWRNNYKYYKFIKLIIVLMSMNIQYSFAAEGCNEEKMHAIEAFDARNIQSAFAEVASLLMWPGCNLPSSFYEDDDELLVKNVISFIIYSSKSKYITRQVRPFVLSYLDGKRNITEFRLCIVNTKVLFECSKEGQESGTIHNMTQAIKELEEYIKILRSL